MLNKLYTTFSFLLLALFLSFSLIAQMPTGNQRQCQDDGMISVAFSGATEIATCTDDDNMDRIRFQVQPFFQAFAYVVVDDRDIIRYIGFSNFINFDLLPVGVLRVYAFSNYGRITARTGEVFSDATLSRPCFGLTTNFVTVNNAASGGITINSDLDSYDVCPDDGEADVIAVSSNGLSVTYLITEPDGTLLATNETGNIDFEGAGPGLCYVYAFASPDVLPIVAGDNISALADFSGCGIGLSDNFITVDRSATRGGVVTTDDGLTSASLCPGDGVDDLVTFAVSGNSGDDSRLVITDDNNVIIGLPDGLTVNFETAGVGVCRAWNVSFTGNFTAELGDVLGDDDLSDGCADLSDAFVEVVRESPVGGSVALADGTTETETCPGDGTADVIEFTTTGGEGGTLVYIITNEINEVLGTSETPSFDVEGAGVGACRIWSLTYQGDLTVATGDNLDDGGLADGCFELSDNFITVIRAVPSGGTVTTESGETEVSVCPGDGIDDIITFVSEGADASANFTYLITDEAGVILNVLEGSSANFDGGPEGVCLLWGISYVGELLAEPGDDANTAILANGCFSLSDNFVRVVRTQPDGGMVRLPNGDMEIVVCPNDGVADVLNFISTGTTGDNFTFIVTDVNNNFLTRPLGTAVDFETLPEGICRVYGLSYYGSLSIDEGDNVFTEQLANGCFDLSDNFVMVTREASATGPISTEAGETSILACPGDAEPDVVVFDSTGTGLSNFNYVVTDENNVIFMVAFTDRINFEQLPEGICRVHGLGYDGIIVASPGDTLGVDPLASGCFSLSTNFVTVTKQLPAGGDIQLVGGGNETTVCSQDGVADVVNYESIGAESQNFVYLITTEENSILAVTEDDNFDFDDAPFGICRIWGLAYNGNLLARVGDDAALANLASSCFALSNDFITVTRDDVEGGTISVNGRDSVFTCPGDMVADVVTFNSTGATGSEFQYLITDENNIILALADGDNFDFEPAGTGVCRVWGFAYAGEVTAAAGDDAAAVDLADGCFALTDNFITVIRETPTGGSVSLADGSLAVEVCSGVEEEAALEFITTSTSMNYTYLVVQADSFALTAIDGGFNFNMANGGVYNIYGLAYAGDLSLVPGTNIFTTDLATSCFELSDTFVTVSVTEVDGGDILGNGAEEVYFCPENLEDGLVRLTTSSACIDYRYVITTDTDSPVIINLVEMGADSFDFGSLPLMALRIYAICYDGEFQAAAGSSLEFSPLASGCVDLSNNFIRVLNDTPEAGTISFDDVPGTNIFCTVDGDSTLSVSTTSTSQTGYAIIVTDEMNIVQLVTTDPTNVALGSLPEAAYRVYGLAYTGNVIAMVGDDITIAVLADNCYELTPVFLEVRQSGEISAGMLINATTEGTGDTITFCIPDGDNPIAVIEATVSGPNYRYIVTDDNGRVRVANLPGGIIPFQPFGSGVYRIYGFNFTGQSLIGTGQDIHNTTLSTGCGALTGNYITVRYANPDGGMVTTAAGESEIEVEITGSGDDAVALVDVVNTSDSLNRYAYVISDENNIIQSISRSNRIDFGPAGVGVCRVWGVSFTGSITAMIGDNAGEVPLSDLCYVLSETFLTVTRVDNVGFTGTEEEEMIHVGFSDLTMTARPNPVTGNMLYLDLDGLVGVPSGQVFVRDMNGVAYSVQNLTGGPDGTTLELDISGLPAGMYFVQLTSEFGAQSVRFMKN